MFYKELITRVLELACIVAIPTFFIFFYVALGFQW